MYLQHRERLSGSIPIYYPYVFLCPVSDLVPDEDTGVSSSIQPFFYLYSFTNRPKYNLINKIGPFYECINILGFLPGLLSFTLKLPELNLTHLFAINYFRSD